MNRREIAAQLTSLAARLQAVKEKVESREYIHRILNDLEALHAELGNLIDHGFGEVTG